MDAIGAHAPEPDDNYLFKAIVAGLDGPMIEQNPTVRPEPETKTTPPAREQAAPPSLAPAPAPAVEPIPLPVKPQRPALTEPNCPKPPGLEAIEATGRRASLIGYIMSVAVGAFGQIAFLGTWLGEMLPSPGNWFAAVIGAAFAEIGMIGAGNSSLTKRRDGGRWRLLFFVACAVCASAVTMQVVHWYPKGVGVALVFGLGSFVGFLIHMTIEHGKIRDHEDRVARFKIKQAAYQAEEQARYEQDLAAYNAAVAEQRRQGRQDAKKVTVPVEPSSAPVATAPAAKAVGGRPPKPDALRIGVERKADTPSKLRAALVDAGYTLPSSTTIENWCREIKLALAPS